MPRKPLQPPMNNSLITQHFQRKSEVIEVEEEKEIKKKATVEFYEQSLQENIKFTQSCENDSCSVEIDELKKKIATAKSELSRILVGQSTVISICEEKDMQIECLESEIELIPKNSECANDINPIRNDTPMHHEPLSSQKQPTSNVQLFTRFVNDFTDDQLENIRKIGNATAEDSSFFLKILRSLYYADLSKLFTVSATGCSLKGQKKEKIQEEKMNILKGMFQERLENLRNATNQTEIDNRLSKLNKLLNTAITNIQKSIKKIDQIKKTQFIYLFIYLDTAKTG